MTGSGVTARWPPVIRGLAWAISSPWAYEPCGDRYYQPEYEKGSTDKGATLHPVGRTL